jgi:hypothetical protein
VWKECNNICTYYNDDKHIIPYGYDVVYKNNVGVNENPLNIFHERCKDNNACIKTYCDKCDYYGVFIIDSTEKNISDTDLDNSKKPLNNLLDALGDFGYVVYGIGILILVVVIVWIFKSVFG